MIKIIIKTLNKKTLTSFINKHFVFDILFSINKNFFFKFLPFILPMSQRPITVSEASFILSSINHTISNYEPTKRYLNTFCKLRTRTDTKDMRDTLSQHFNEEQVTIIGSLLPSSIEELKSYIGDSDIPDEILRDVVGIILKLV